MDSFPPPEPGAPLTETEAPRISLALPRHPVLVSYILLGLNIAIFIIDLLSGRLLTVYGLRINEALTAGEYWRLITPALLHGNLLHLGFNSYFLYVVGPQLERSFGALRFLAIYILSAMGGVILGYLFSNSNSLGASGALFGMMGALAAFIYLNRNTLADSRARLISLAQLIGINLLIGLMPTIDNWGHLGGLLAGAGLSLLIAPRYKLSIEPGGMPRVVDSSQATQNALFSGMVFAALLVIFFAIRAMRL